ncbi:MAG: Rpn family recombination-promoting nuclease/putative transposase [Lamprocystis purpurea]|jgi:predicted transposase/invertase (TIGR01784 family)|uniref:Rpn family recombination-promoting nuclease/putative transposase n=1 Tax=Lamprocystis purpurea TaxID=61598 RepID=UPI00036441AE|nr:Rpn family recombination-promoting nuclease/putative transposase [Lamprocystis purpurea]MBV5272400.1 Rpn family recombination-promoting nuclease/putative transposase [Lamprocystis purpurea]
MATRKLISFDWAMKRLLRSKANFGILEGFLSELLREDVQIVEVLESESNRDTADDRSNRLDLKVRNHRGELVLIEVQYERRHDDLSRMLYGSARALVEHLDVGQSSANLVKVISVNILYFDLGHGEDYVYHGTTRFCGLHKHDELALSRAQRKLFPGRERTHELFPEYYLIKVERFDDIVRDTLDEWIYYLKHQSIQDGFSAKGLSEAKEKLAVLGLAPAERAAYERWQEDLHLHASLVASNFVVGKIEGREERTLEIARAMKANGVAASVIAESTGLALEVVAGL